MTRPRTPAALLLAALGCAACAGTRLGAGDVVRPTAAYGAVATGEPARSATARADAVRVLLAVPAASPVARAPAGSWIRERTGAIDGDEPASAAAPESAGGDEELAKKLSNPIASLISVPLQSNWDSGMGPDGRGKRYVLNVQPVVPISLSDDWNLISRTIVPVIDQHEIVPGAGDQSGVGDITQSVFFSPKQPTGSGWIWGAGPVVLVPTAGDDLLGADKWAAGPTVVLLKQDSGWTYGALASQLWSFAGSGSRNEVNSGYLQPFVSYTTKDLWTFGVNAEATYDWLGDDLGVPVNASVSKLVRIGGAPVSLSAGARYWAERTETGPEGFGFRLAVTFLFPAGR